MDLKKALPYSHQTGYGRAFLAYLFSPALQAPRVRSAAKLTEGASQDGETERGAGTGHSHVSNVSTIFAHTMKPTVATISTKSRFHAYQRFPRPQRLPRNAPCAISCKPLPSVESWKRWNRGRAAKKKKTRNSRSRSLGGDKRDRTADLLNAIGALSRSMRSRTPPTGQRKHKRKRGCDVFSDAA